MIPTIPYIQSCFDEYNTRFFADSLPPIHIKLSNARTFLGKVTFVKHRKWLFGDWIYSNFTLRINTRYDLPEELIQDTILHEMIHYYIAINHLRDTSTHGRLFRSEMKRINAEGNRHITISCRNLPIESSLRKTLLFLMLASGFMTLQAQTETQLTNLPTVYITTQNGQEPYDKEHELRCQICIVNGGSRLIDSANVRLRGNFSTSFPKKPYHVKFDSKHTVLGSPAKAKRWTLINNYGDKTLMRNLLAFDLSRRLEMPYTPFGTPVDLVINGDYKGCYQLCDQIQVNKGRVEVDEGGFLIEADAYAYDEDVWFTSNKGTPVSIHYPDDDEITEEQKIAINEIFNNIERRSHPNLDLETFLRHFLVGEISGNTDTYWSTYFYKNSTSDLVYTGPVWDFDLAYENDNRTFPICDKTDFIYRTYGSCAGDMRNFTDNAILRSPGKERLAAIYAQYRNSGALSSEALIGVVDSLENHLTASAERNFERWPILDRYVHQNPRVGGSYSQEVQWVREYIAKRIAWMDNKLNYTPSSHAITQPTAEQLSGTKILRDGQLLILRGNKIYTITGQELTDKID